MELNRIAKDARAWREDTGLHTPKELSGPNDRAYIPAKMMEATEGIGQAAQAVRENNFDRFSYSLTMGEAPDNSEYLQAPGMKIPECCCTPSEY